MAKYYVALQDVFSQQNVVIERTEIDGIDSIEICFYNGSVDCENISHSIYLDKSTAIKFAKTLRTEINKITESEVNNG